MTGGRWFRAEVKAWALLMEGATRPVDPTIATADLRYLYYEHPDGLPTLEGLAKRWGWFSPTGRPSKKRVRLLLRREDWRDPYHDERAAEVAEAELQAKISAWWSGVRSALGLALTTPKGHGEGTGRAREGHGEGTETTDEPPERSSKGHGEGTARAREGHGKGYARVTQDSKQEHDSSSPPGGLTGQEVLRQIGRWWPAPSAEVLAWWSEARPTLALPDDEILIELRRWGDWLQDRHSRPDDGGPTFPSSWRKAIRTWLTQAASRYTPPGPRPTAHETDHVRRPRKHRNGASRGGFRPQSRHGVQYVDAGDDDPEF